MSLPDDGSGPKTQPDAQPGSTHWTSPLVNGLKDGLMRLSPKPDGNPGYEQRTAYNAGYVVGYLGKALLIVLGTLYGVDLVNAGL